MASTGRELLNEIASEMAVPTRMMIAPGMAELAAVDLGPLSLTDQAVLKATFVEALGRMSREFDGGTAAVDPRAITLALQMARHRLMSPDSTLTNAGRDFVAAHCPCG